MRAMSISDCEKQVDVSLDLDHHYRDSLGLRILNIDPDKIQGKSQKQMLAEIKAD